MNDGNNDEFSVAKKMTEGSGKQEEEVCLLFEHIWIFRQRVYLNVPQSQR